MMIKLRLSILTIIVQCLFTNYTTAQSNNNPCLEIDEGYIVKIIEKSKDDQLTRGIDYLFFSQLPEIKKSSTPLSFYEKEGKIMDMSSYRTFNLEHTMTKGFIEFDVDSGNIYSIKSNKKFKFEIYRTVLVFSVENEQLITLVEKNETSHSYMYLSNLPDKELNQTIKVIQPFVISTW